MNKTFGDPHGKGAFIYGTKDNAAMRRGQERDRKFDPQPQKPKIAGPSPVPVNYGWTNVRVGSGRGGGLLAGLAKLFVIGVIILALGGYFGSHQSGPARRPSPSETAPRASYATQPSHTSPPPYAMPPEGPPEDAGANVTDQQESSDTRTAVPTPANSSVLTAPSPTPQSTVPPIDPNDDWVGAGGFITPPGLASRPAPEPVMDRDVERTVQVCVPASLENSQWGSPPPGSKMEAFGTATKKMIREIAAGTYVNYATHFEIVDVLDSFTPGTSDPRGLVRVVDWANSTHQCPAGDSRYELDVKTRQRQ
jgi:hypothetical protein